jgi:hypothetical protein
LEAICSRHGVALGILLHSRLDPVNTQSLPSQANIDLAELQQKASLASERVADTFPHLGTNDHEESVSLTALKIRLCKAIRACRRHQQQKISALVHHSGNNFR